jgi:hypothetical protein
LPLTERGRAPGGVATAAEPGAAAGRSGAPGSVTAVRWELLVEPHGRSGAENMAIDVELLGRADRTGEAFLRFYRFDPPCLSLGRNEAAGGYDRAAIARLGVDVLRRPTGGRAVWHEHELTYAVAAPVAAFGSPRRAYRAIHERIAAALRGLGADATLAVHRPSPPSTALHHPPPSGVLLRAARRGGSPHRRAEDRRVCPGAPRSGVPATRIDPARGAARRSCGDHAVGRIRTTHHVARGGRRDRVGVGRRVHPYRPLPSSTVLYRLVSRPRLDLASLTSPWNLRAPWRPPDRPPG